MSIKLDKVFATCKKCGANVGCGCNLKNGLCLACASQANKK